ncbi:Fructokinase [Sphingomonas antarctica]|uniref:ROK family protein n=1 Tax=Sphingomonas antarctica TaxID=2040274 RepID=UPI0039EC7DB2
MTVLAAIETGGTKIFARLFTADGAILAEQRFVTRDGDAAVADLVPFLGSHGALAAIGMSAFGPIIVDPQSPRFGEIMPTTKAGWTGTNLTRALTEKFGCPIAIDTDVGGAALAEARIGAGRGFDPVAYVTIGTGIGGGLYVGGKTYHGSVAPEIGHSFVQRADGDTTASICRYHTHCAEGLASGPSARARLGTRQLVDAPEVRATLADYIAQLLFGLTLSWAPGRFVIGGGVMLGTGMLDDVRAAFPDKVNGFGAGERALADDYIVPAQLTNAGLEGAAIMAQELLAR